MEALEERIKYLVEVLETIAEGAERRLYKGYDNGDDSVLKMARQAIERERLLRVGVLTD